MRLIRRFLGLTGIAVGLGAVVMTALAWACVPVATLNVSPAQVRPGEQVTVTGNFYGTKNPVLIRFNALDGPALATITPTDSAGRTGTSDSRLLNGRVTIPSDVKPGNYVLIATQEPDLARTTWGIPSRALVTVVGAGGAPVVGPQLGAADTGRPVGLSRGDSVSAGELALVGLGVAGVAMFLAGMTALAAGRRAGVPQAVRARR